MKRIPMNWLPFLLALLVGLVEAQAAEPVPLHIRFRYSDGSPVTGVPVSLQRLPGGEAVAPDCTTDANGTCSWRVAQGLYQIGCDRPLDPVSALAAAESGMTGLGVTVGEEAMTYDLVFHHDGHVYFDTTPDDVRPSPFIPSMDDLGGEKVTMPSAPAVNEPLSDTFTPEPAQALSPVSDPSGAPSGRLLLFAGGGLILGGCLHYWARRRQVTTSQVSPSSKEPPHA